MTPPRGSNRESAQLILDLVTNTLDPGYRAAATRRGQDHRRRWYDRPAVALGCLLIGFVLVVAYDHTHRGAPEAEKVHQRLVQRVRTAQGDADALSRQLTTAENALSRAQNLVLPKTGPAASQRAAADQAAGAIAVHGPGLTVTLREPTSSPSSAAGGRVGSIPIGSTNILTDRDVRSVVNVLWSSGAEAIAVNGIRLTPTSAIRFAGEAVLVDFQPIQSPFRIEAIGDADTLSTDFAQSAVASRYQTLAGADGIGFSFHTKGSLELPAGAPAVTRYATPAPTPTRSGR